MLLFPSAGGGGMRYVRAAFAAARLGFTDMIVVPIPPLHVLRRRNATINVFRLRPQDVGWGRGLDECARRSGEFVVHGDQRVGLQLGQCDVLGLVDVRPVQLGG